MLKILIINGANLNLLGMRESEHYGNLTLEEIIKRTDSKVRSSNLKVELTWRQSNIEGEIVNFIQDAINKYDGIVINPGGYSHTSVSILDALKTFKKPKAEVHLSQLSGRSDHFRKSMITASGSDILLEGLADLSYFIGVFSIYTKLNDKDGK